MATLLKQSTAVDIALGPFVDSTDGVTAETGLTISQADVRLKKNAGNWAQKADTNAATHEENGWYECALNTTDTDTLGILVVAVNESGALPVWREFQVVPAAVYDALISGTGNGVRADVQVLANNAITAAAIATDAIDNDALAANAITEIQTGLATAAALTTVSGLVDDLESRLGTPSNLGGGATIAANLADIEAQTDDIGTAGAGLTAIPWNAAWDAEVQSEVDDALVVQRLDELLAADSDIDGAAPPTVGSVFHELMTKTAGSFTYDQTTDSLEAVRDRGDAAWTTGTSLDAAGVRAAVGLAAANLDTQLAAIDDAVDTEVAAILAAVDTEVAAIKAKTDNLPAAPAAVGDIPTAVQNADALLDRTAGVETGLTPRQALRLIAAALAGELSGAATTTVTIRNAVADSKDRIVATVDVDGNRTAVVYDLT